MELREKQAVVCFNHQNVNVAKRLVKKGCDIRRKLANENRPRFFSDPVT